MYSRLNIHCIKQLTLCTILWYLYRYGKMKDLFYFNLLGDSFSLISYIWHRTYMKHQVLTSRLTDLNSLKYYCICALQNLTLLHVQTFIFSNRFCWLNNITFKSKKVHIRIAITFMKMLNLENYTGIQIVLLLTKSPPKNWNNPNVLYFYTMTLYCQLQTNKTIG